MNEKRMKATLESIARRAVPENTNLWPRIAAQLDERESLMKALRARPLAAIPLALLILLSLSGMTYAAAAALGFIPGIGLVENTGGLRVLEQPVSATRDGVIVTVRQVLVYKDHVKLVYEVAGVLPTAEFGPGDAGNETAFCSLPDGDARLRLPDGTIVQPAALDIYEQQPTYRTSIPAAVNEMTMLLKCLPHTRLGAVPENWEVPFKLVYAPAGTVVGEPVKEVIPQPTATGSVSPQPDAPGATATLTDALPPVGSQAISGPAQPFEPDYRFNGVIGLAQPDVNQHGDQTQICLRWLSLSPVAIDYQVFVHILSGQGAVLGQWDFSPKGGRYPTSAWSPGESINDCMTLDTPGLPAQGWHIAVGLYDPASGVRLPVFDRSGQPVPNNEIVISPK